MRLSHSLRFGDDLAKNLDNADTVYKGICGRIDWHIAGSGIATAVFGLSPFLTHTAVLLAALPTGTGPFMLAEFYRREAHVTSSAVLVSTIMAVATISGYLAVMGAG